MFELLCGPSKGFMKALKAFKVFIKPFEAQEVWKQKFKLISLFTRDWNGKG